MKFKSSTYDILKWCAMLFLPALAALIRAVFAIWNIPYGDQISGTILAFQVFLGACLGISHIQYKANEELDPE